MKFHELKKLMTQAPISGKKAAPSIEAAIGLIKRNPNENSIVFFLSDGKMDDYDRAYESA